MCSPAADAALAGPQLAALQLQAGALASPTAGDDDDSPVFRCHTMPVK